MAYLSEVLLVSEKEIVEAMLLFWERTKLIIEPSAAVGVAAILKNKQLFKGKKGLDLFIQKSK